MIRFIDLFSGIGGFHLGLTGDTCPDKLQAQGGRWNSNEGASTDGCSTRTSSGAGEHTGEFRCVWANDWDKYASKIYQSRFPETPFISGDIRKVEVDSIPDHDLLCAGFPCQAFSVAGKRRGFEDTRGTLFYEIARIAERKRPRLLLLENVKGLLSHDKGHTFGTILEVLGSLGYWCEWQVLNSKWFGVPQNRERVFIIGYLGEEPARTVFPITETGEKFDPKATGESEEQVVNCIDGNYWKGPDKHGQRTMIQIGNLYENKADAGRVYSTDGVARTLKGESGGLGGKMGLYEIQPLKFLNRNQRNFEDTAMTVDTANSTGIKEGSRIRRLTPLECERLQGFPDGWTEGVSDTQRYKMLGNAVTVNVIEYLGVAVRNALEPFTRQGVRSDDRV